MLLRCPGLLSPMYMNGYHMGGEAAFVAMEKHSTRDIAWATSTNRDSAGNAEGNIFYLGPFLLDPSLRLKAAC